MNLQLTPEQALAIYELIIATTVNAPKKDFVVRLEEVKCKLQITMTEALCAVCSSSNKGKFDSWIKNEQDKISKLNFQLEKLKCSSTDISTFSCSDDGLHFPPQK